MKCRYCCRHGELVSKCVFRFPKNRHKKERKTNRSDFSCDGCNCPLSVRHLNGNNSQPVHWFCNDVCTWRHSEIPYFILFAVFVDVIVVFFLVCFFGIVFALLFTFSQLIGCNNDVFLCVCWLFSLNCRLCSFWNRSNAFVVYFNYILFLKIVNIRCTHGHFTQLFNAHAKMNLHSKSTMVHSTALWFESGARVFSLGLIWSGASVLYFCSSTVDPRIQILSDKCISIYEISKWNYFLKAVTIRFA